MALSALRDFLLGPAPAPRGLEATVAAPRVPAFAALRAGSPNLAGVTEWPSLTVARESALSIPAVKSCRDLIVGAGVQMGLFRFRGVERLEPGALLTQPDPDCSRAATLAGTLEDLLYDGRAYWLVLARDGLASERLPEGFPVRARWIPTSDVEPLLERDRGSYSVLTGYRVAGIEEDVEPHNVIRFDSPLGGVLYRGADAINKALDLEDAAARMASVELPAGTLTNTGSELSDEEGLELIDKFETARRNHTVAFLQGVEYEREQLSSEDLQLVEARANSATEMARLHNVPVGMIGASPSGGASAMLYANLGAMLTLLTSTAVQPLLVTVEQTLSGDDVSPRGQSVAFDVATFLRSDPSELRAHVLELLAAGVIDRDEARALLGVGPGAAPADATSLQPGEA